MFEFLPEKYLKFLRVNLVVEYSCHFRKLLNSVCESVQFTL